MTVSALEQYNLIDLKRLCEYWGDMQRYPNFGPERCYRMLHGYFMLSKLPYEVFKDFELLLEICEMIAHPERYQEAA